MLVNDFEMRTESRSFFFGRGVHLETQKRLEQEYGHTFRQQGMRSGPKRAYWKDKEIIALISIWSRFFGLSLLFSSEMHFKSSVVIWRIEIGFEAIKERWGGFGFMSLPIKDETEEVLPPINPKRIPIKSMVHFI